MAIKNQTLGSGPAQESEAQQLYPIETLREKHKIPPVTYAGLCAANAWKLGRQVLERDFLAALWAFQHEPMQGRKAVR